MTCLKLADLPRSCLRELPDGLDRPTVDTTCVNQASVNEFHVGLVHVTDNTDRFFLAALGQILWVTKEST